MFNFISSSGLQGNPTSPRTSLPPSPPVCYDQIISELKESNLRLQHNVEDMKQQLDFLAKSLQDERFKSEVSQVFHLLLCLQILFYVCKYFSCAKRYAWNSLLNTFSGVYGNLVTHLDDKHFLAYTSFLIKSYTFGIKKK